VDVPAGVDASSGRAHGEHIRPKYTLALGLPFGGLSEQNAGKIYLTDLGVPSSLYEKVGLPYPNIFSDQFILKLRTNSSSS
jgi:NAD(P)H-hydrate epimerase